LLFTLDTAIGSKTLADKVSATTESFVLASSRQQGSSRTIPPEEMESVATQAALSSILPPHVAALHSKS